MALSSTKIVVGIDFGTTYSSVAFTTTHHTCKNQRPVAITVWPKSATILEGQSSSKVPTKVYYDASNAIHWGFSVPMNLADAGARVKAGFKLALEPGLLGMPGVPVVPAQEAERITTDYMTALLEHTLYIIRRKMGDEIVRSTPFEFVVTVPTIWSERAKEATRRAAQAGTTKVGKPQAPIHLVSEPEAAAMYALHELDPHGLKIGDTFMVCDAGGDTVDLITYTITQLEPTLQIREAAPGIGEMCGSRYVDDEFRRFFRGRFSCLPDFDDEVLEEAVQHFKQEIKREVTFLDINNNSVLPFGINAFGLPDNSELGIRRARFYMKSSDMFSVFEPVISSVIKLVDDQIAASDAEVKAVFLVGSFGSSNYLRERLENHLRGVKVMQPPNSLLALSFGAVMKGVAACDPEHASVTVSSRRARKHFFPCPNAM